jgi:hypothetical protein
MNIDEIIRIAKDLGIKLTNAEEGTEMYRAWADRVMLAFHIPTEAMIAEASRYAI